MDWSILVVLDLRILILAIVILIVLIIVLLLKRHQDDLKKQGEMLKDPKRKNLFLKLASSLSDSPEDMKKKIQEQNLLRLKNLDIPIIEKEIIKKAPITIKEFKEDNKKTELPIKTEIKLSQKLPPEEEKDGTSLPISTEDRSNSQQKQPIWAGDITIKELPVKQPPKNPFKIKGVEKRKENPKEKNIESLDALDRIREKILKRKNPPYEKLGSIDEDSEQVL